MTFAPPPPSGYVLADGSKQPLDPLGGAGDINGDGYPDFAFCAQWTNATSGNNFETYVFPGGSPLPTAPSLTLALGQMTAVR